MGRDSHNNWTLLRHILAPNDMDFREERDNGPTGDAADNPVSKVGIRHGQQVRDSETAGGDGGRVEEAKPRQTSSALAQPRAPSPCTSPVMASARATGTCRRVRVVHSRQTRSTRTFLSLEPPARHLCDTQTFRNYLQMHTVYSRINNVSAMVSTCLMILLGAISLSSFLFTASPKGTIGVSSIQVSVLS